VETKEIHKLLHRVLLNQLISLLMHFQQLMIHLK